MGRGLREAGAPLAVERGYAATRLEDVAKHAGVSKGTLYLYFANKEELFKAVVRANIVATIGEAEQDADAFDGPSGELLGTLLMKWWEEICATPLGGITKLMLAEGNNFPELAQFYNEEVVARGSNLFARVLARESAVICGGPWVEAVLRQVDPNLHALWLVPDGRRCKADEVVLEIDGLARSLLTVERTALNFLQLLSAVATKTAVYVEAVRGTRAQIVDTRKTLPGLRLAQKYAVRTGGGVLNATTWMPWRSPTSTGSASSGKVVQP